MNIVYAEKIKLLCEILSSACEHFLVLIAVMALWTGVFFPLKKT